MFFTYSYKCFRPIIYLFIRSNRYATYLVLLTSISLTGCFVTKSSILENSPLKIHGIAHYSNDNHQLVNVHFTKNNKQLLLNYGVGVYLFDIEESNIAYDFNNGHSTTRVVLSESNKYLLITTGVLATLWDFNSRNKLKQWDISVDMLGAISPDEKRLLVGKNIVDIESLKTVTKLDVISSISKPAFSPDSRYLIVSSNIDNQLYDLDKQQEIANWYFGGRGTEGFFTPDAKYLILQHNKSSGVFGNSIIRDALSIYATGSEKPLFSISAGADITAYAFERKNQQLFVATEKGKIMRWDIDAQKMLGKWVGDGQVTAMDADDNGNVWISFENGDIMLYQGSSQQISKVMTLPNDVFALSVSRDGKLLSVIESIMAKSEVTVYEIKSDEIR